MALAGWRGGGSNAGDSVAGPRRLRTLHGRGGILHRRAVAQLMSSWRPVNPICLRPLSVATARRPYVGGAPALARARPMHPRDRLSIKSNRTLYYS